jgi:hypothetical protein
MRPFSHRIQHRMTHDKTEGQMCSFFTPVQQEWRQGPGLGRWQADAVQGTHATAHHMRQHPEGTVDLVRLDADGQFWMDLGGFGARDMACGRPW